jgi:hypothetical protein
MRDLNHYKLGFKSTSNSQVAAVEALMISSTKTYELAAIPDFYENRENYYLC